MNTQIIKEKTKIYWEQILNFIKTKKVLSSIIGLIIVFIFGYFIFGGSKDPNYTTIIAKRGTIIQEVSVTGRVKAAQSVDLAFEKTGKVAHIYVNIGDKVSAGQKLISLTNDDISAQLLQAEAGVQNAQATLDELKKGSRPEDIAISQSELQKATQDLDNYYSAALDVLNDSYIKSNDAVRNQTVGIFSNEESNSPQLTFIVSDTQAQIDAQNQRILSRDALDSWNTELNGLKNNPSHELIDQSISNSKVRLLTIKNFLNRLLDAVQSSANNTSATINTYKTNINTARAEVNTAATNISNQEQSISSQKLTVTTYQNQLSLKIAGSSAEQIAAQEASVKEATANVQNYSAQLEKTIIRAPFNGIVVRQDAKIGEISAANTPLVSVMSSAKFQTEAFIPEVDIPKVKIGNDSEITLDAYGNDTIFQAKVIKIDPAETLIEGVATYKATLQFIAENDLIKSGMTANIDILTAKKENAIFIPQRSIKTNGEKTVIVLNEDGSTKNAIVETGLKGSDGNVEIINGINEGDAIITSSK
jgi:HlyD family secretion protein